MTVRPVDATDPLPPINILYKAKRMDETDHAYGQDLEFVANVDGSVMLEQLIQEKLLTSSCGDPQTHVNDTVLLTREEIEVTPLGVSSMQLPLGIVMIVNGGA